MKKIDINNMTLEEAVEAHRLLWNEISRELEKNSANKEELIRIYVLKNQVLHKVFPEINNLDNDCFACQYNTIMRGRQDVCDFCPFYVTDEIDCMGGLYDACSELCYDHKYKEAAQIAKLIADFPVLNPQ